MMKNIKETKRCPKCTELFSAEKITFTAAGVETIFQQNYCEKCIDEFDAKSDEAQKCASGINRPKWESFAPKLYDTFNLCKLPVEAESIFDNVMEWRADSEKGIGLKGASGTGKSFLLHRLFQDLYKNQNKSVCLTTGTEFAYACGSPDQAERRALINRAIRADVTLFDDLGKEKITDRVESDLFMVIDERRRAMKPLFVTLNSDSKTLSGRMHSDFQEPLIRRLRDSCEFRTMGK